MDSKMPTKTDSSRSAALAKENGAKMDFIVKENNGFF